jgi:hypothetical protein
MAPHCGHQHGLRGYDSSHLAAAERLGATTVDDEVILAAFDVALISAAKKLGIKFL